MKYSVYLPVGTLKKGLFFVLLLLLACTFYSCKKKEVSSPSQQEDASKTFRINENDILGTWQLTEITGGVAGMHINTRDSLVFLTLKEDSTFVRIKKGAQLCSGSFRIFQDYSPLFQEKNTYLKGVNCEAIWPLSYRFIMSMQEDKMYFSEEIYDGFVYVYERVE